MHKSRPIEHKSSHYEPMHENQDEFQPASSGEWRKREKKLMINYREYIDVLICFDHARCCVFCLFAQFNIFGVVECVFSLCSPIVSFVVRRLFFHVILRLFIFHAHLSLIHIKCKFQFNLLQFVYLTDEILSNLSLWSHKRAR